MGEGLRGIACGGGAERYCMWGRGREVLHAREGLRGIACGGGAEGIACGGGAESY